MAEKIKKQDGQSASFNIPKIKRSASQAVLRKVDVASRDVQDLMKEFDRSFLDVTYKDQWKLTSVEFVDNSALEKAYRKKRAELKDGGRNARELLELLSYMPFKKASFAVGVAKEGLLVKSHPNHYLGDCSFGVHVCKHADPVLRSGESVRETHVMVFKITPGRCKAVVSNRAGRLEPTPNYDCHVSSVQPKSNDTYMDQLSRSQIYLYEYDENAEACKRPRHCLPYAVLHLEMKRQVEKQKTHLPVNPNLISPSAASAGWTSSTRWTVPEASRSQAQEANSVACKSLTKITAQERESCNKSAPLKMSHLPAEAEFLRSSSCQEAVGVPKSGVFASSNSGQGNPDRVKGDTIQTCDTGGKTFSQLGKGNDDRAIGEGTKEVTGTKYQSAVCPKRDPRLKRNTSDDADNKINSEKDGPLVQTSDRNNFQEPETDSLGSSFRFLGESKLQCHSDTHSEISLPAEQTLLQGMTDFTGHSKDRRKADPELKDGTGNDFTTNNFNSPLQDMIKKVNKLFGRGVQASGEEEDSNMESNSMGVMDEIDDGHPFNSWGLTWKGDECGFGDKEISRKKTDYQSSSKTDKQLNSKQNIGKGRDLNKFGDHWHAVPLDTVPILSDNDLASLCSINNQTLTASQEKSKGMGVQLIKSVATRQPCMTGSDDLTKDFLDIDDYMTFEKTVVASSCIAVTKSDSLCHENLKHGNIRRTISESGELAAIGQSAGINSLSEGKVDIKTVSNTSVSHTLCVSNANRENRLKSSFDAKCSAVPSSEPHTLLPAGVLKPALKRNGREFAGGRKKLSFNDYKQMREKLATQEQKQIEEFENQKAELSLLCKTSDISASACSVGQESASLMEEENTTQNAFELLKSFTQNAQRSLGLFNAFKDASISNGAEKESEQRRGESDLKAAIPQMRFLPFNLKDSRVDATTRVTERTDMHSSFGNVSVQTERNKKSASDVAGVHDSGSDLKQPDQISSKQHNKHANKNLHDLSPKISMPVVGSVEKIHPKETKYSSLSKEIAGSGAAVDECKNLETANLQTKKTVTFEMSQKGGLQISGSAKLSEGKKHEVAESQPVLSVSKGRKKRSRKKRRQQTLNSFEQTQRMLHACEVIPEENHVSSVTECISKSLKSCPLVLLSSGSGKQNNLTLSQNVKEESTFQHMPSNIQHETNEQNVPPKQEKKKRNHSAKKSPDCTETKDYEEAMVRLAKGLRPKGFIYVGGLGKNPSDDPLPVLDRKIRMKKLASETSQPSPESYIVKTQGNEKVSPCCQPEKQTVKKTFKKKQVKGMTGYKKKRKRRMKMEDFIQNPSGVLEDEDININDFQFDDPVDFSETIPYETAPCLDGELASSVQSKGGEEGKNNRDKSVIIKHSASASSLGITSWTDALVRPSLQPQVLLVDLVKAYLKGADFDNCRICQNVIDLSLVEREEAENLPLPQDHLALAPNILEPRTAISDSSTLQKWFEPNNSGHLTKEHISMQNTSCGKEMADADLEAGDLVRKADDVVRGDDTQTQVPVSSQKQKSPGSNINSEGNSGASDVSASLDQKNVATVMTSFGTLKTEHVSVSAKNSEQLYAGIDCVRIIPVETSEHTTVAAEINSQLDASESFTTNTEKVDGVNSEESKNERVCNQETLRKERGSQQEILRCSSLQEKSVTTKTTIKDLVNVPAEVIPVLIDKEPEESVNPCVDTAAVNVVSKISCILPEFEKDDTRYSSLASSYNLEKSPLFAESSIKSRSLVLNPSDLTGRKNNEKKDEGEIASVQWPDTHLQTKEVMPRRSWDVEVNEKRSVKIETVNLMESPSRLQSSSVNSHRIVKNWQQWKSLQAAQFSSKDILGSENKKNAIDVVYPKTDALKTSDIVCDVISNSGVLFDNASLKLASSSTLEKQGSQVSSASDNSSFFDMINKTSSFSTRNSIPGLDLIEEPPLFNNSSVCDGLKFVNEVVSAWKDQETKNVEQGKREILATEEPSVSTALISCSDGNDLEGTCQKEGSSIQTDCSRDQNIVLEQETIELPNVGGACRVPVEKLPNSPITLDISEAEREFSSDCLEENRELEISVKTRPVGIGCPIPSVAKQQVEIKNCINECEEQMSLKADPRFHSAENLPPVNIGQRIENQIPHFIHQESMQPQTVSYENMGNTIPIINIHLNPQQQPGYFTGKPLYVELGQGHHEPYFGSTARPAARFLPTLPGFNQLPQSPYSFLPSPQQTFSLGGKQFPVQHLPNFQQSSAGNITFPMGSVLRHSAVGIVSPMVHGSTVHCGDLNLGNMPPSSTPSYSCNDAADLSKKPSMSCSVSGSDVYAWFSDILSGKRNLSPQGSKLNAKMLRVADTESSCRLGSPVEAKPFAKSKDKTKRLKSENDDTSSDKEKPYSHSSTKSRPPSSSKARFKHFGEDDYFEMSHRSKSQTASYSRSKTLQTDSTSSPNVSHSLKDGYSDRFRRKNECVGSDDLIHSPCFLKDRLSRSKRRTKYSRSPCSSGSSNLEKNRSSSLTKRKKTHTDTDDSRSFRGTKPKTKHLASEGFGCGHKMLDGVRGSSTDLRDVSKTSKTKIVISSTKSLESEKTGSKFSRNRISDVAKKKDIKGRKVLDSNNKTGCTTSRAAVSCEVILLDSEKKRNENVANIQSGDVLLIACEKSFVKDNLNTYITGESGCPVVAQSDRSESAGSSFSSSEESSSVNSNSPLKASCLEDFSKSRLQEHQMLKRKSRWDQKRKASELLDNKEDDGGDLDGFAHELLEAEIEPKIPKLIALPETDIATAIISSKAKNNKQFAERQKEGSSSSISKRFKGWRETFVPLKALKELSRSNSVDSEDNIVPKKISDDEMKPANSPQSSGSTCSILADTSLEVLSYAREMILQEMKNLQNQTEELDDKRSECSGEVSACGADVLDFETKFKVEDDDPICTAKSSHTDSFAINILNTNKRIGKDKKERVKNKDHVNLMQKSETDLTDQKTESEQNCIEERDNVDSLNANAELAGPPQSEDGNCSALKEDAPKNVALMTSQLKIEQLNNSTVTEEEMSSLTDMILKHLKDSSEKTHTDAKASEDPILLTNSCGNNDEKSIECQETLESKSAKDEGREVQVEDRKVVSSHSKSLHAALHQGGQMWSNMLISKEREHTLIESQRQNRNNRLFACLAQDKEKGKRPEHSTTRLPQQKSQDCTNSCGTSLEQSLEISEKSSLVSHQTTAVPKNVQNMHNSQHTGIVKRLYPNGITQDTSEIDTNEGARKLPEVAPKCTAEVDINESAQKTVVQKRRMIAKPEPVGHVGKMLHMPLEQSLDTFPVDQIEIELGLIQECLNLLEAMQKKQIVDQFDTGIHLPAVDSNVYNAQSGSQRGQQLIQRSCLSRATFSVVRESLCSVASDFHKAITVTKKGNIGRMHQSLPRALLLPDELDTCNTKEGSALILLLSIPPKPYKRLQELQKVIVESVSRSRRFALDNNTLGVTQEKLRQKDFRKERSNLLITFTGRLNSKRLQKLKTIVNHYDNCHAHLERVLGTESLSKMTFFLALYQAVKKHLQITQKEMADSAIFANSW